MKNNNQTSNPFEYRTTPKDDWEFVWWCFVDNNRVVTHIKERGFNRLQELMLVLKMFLKTFYVCSVPLIVSIFLLWIIGITLMAATDLLNITPVDWWQIEVLQKWQTLLNFTAKFQYLFWHQIDCLVIGLAVGLAVGLVSDLIVGLVFGLLVDLTLGLVFGLVIGLAIGLAAGLAVDLAVDLTVGLAFGLSAGLSAGLAVDLTAGLAAGLAAGLLLGLVGSLAVGLAFGLAFGLAAGLLYITYFSLFRHRLALDHNVYLIFSKIDISLFLEPQLISQTQENPESALQLVDFLWQHRPKQHNLAALLAHVAFAEQWKNAAIDLNEQTLSFPLTSEQKSFAVPNLWQEQLTSIKEASLIAQTTPQISLKVVLFKDFITALEALYKSTLVAPQKTWRDNISMTRRINWHTYYSEAIAEWLKIAKERYTELQENAKLIEPISPNKYQTGGALSVTYNQDVFMQRDDLKDKLATLLYTTTNFSVFFLQGQRRVGKTSLLKFMPQILGNRFELVFFDLQGSITNVSDFLAKWYAAFCQHFSLEKKPLVSQQATWGETFTQTLVPLFNQTAKDRNCKIILALDEYEELHKHLNKDFEQAAELLGAIRHFTQHQQEVSIMFVGLQFFSELENPNWNEYFPQSVPIKVDYLNQAKTFKLIEVSALDFEDGMKQNIY